MDEKRKEVKGEYKKEIIGGVYENTMNVMHTPEEFIMGFYMIVPQTGVAAARGIISPGQKKRIMDATKKNIEMYEKKFEKIKPVVEPAHDTSIRFKL